MVEHAVWGLVAATFVAAFVEFVEALTIVLAMGLTRGWRSALAGTLAALVALCGFTAVVGYSLAAWLPRSALQLVVGVLLLIFGLQWLRKAILRSAGLKARHDETQEFDEQTRAARAAGQRHRFGLDWFGFVVSFKGVFLEGVEVVFVVITFGLNAGNVPVAAVSAVLTGLVVTTLGVPASRPLSAVPENTLKYAVGLLLATYGTFWAVEGLGLLHGGRSLTWPGGDAALLAILGGWLLLSRVLVATLPRPAAFSSITSGSSFHLSAKFSSSCAGLGTHHLPWRFSMKSPMPASAFRVAVNRSTSPRYARAASVVIRMDGPVVRVGGEAPHAVPLENLHEPLQGGADLPRNWRAVRDGGRGGTAPKLSGARDRHVQHA